MKMIMVALKNKTIKKKVAKVKKTIVRSVLPARNASHNDAGGQKTRIRKTSAKKRKGVELKRAVHNPIIEPRVYPWESKTTFYSAAFLHKRKKNIVFLFFCGDDFFFFWF